MEYCRRLKPDARIGRGYQHELSSEFKSAPILVEEKKIYDVTEDCEGVWKNDDKTLTYTSKHGISISFELEGGM